MSAKFILRKQSNSDLKHMHSAYKDKFSDKTDLFGTTTGALNRQTSDLQNQDYQKGVHFG